MASLRRKGELIHMKIYQEDKVAIIGSWPLPSELIDNFDRQADIGWHIMTAMKNGADKIVIEIEPKEVMKND